MSPFPKSFGELNRPVSSAGGPAGESARRERNRQVGFLAVLNQTTLEWPERRHFKALRQAFSVGFHDHRPQTI